MKKIAASSIAFGVLALSACTHRVERVEKTVVQPERVVVERQPEIIKKERVIESDGMGVRQETTTYSR